MLNTATRYPVVITLIALLVPPSITKAEENAAAPDSALPLHSSDKRLSSGPGYAVFPSPRIQPGISDGASLIGGAMNIEGTATKVYAVSFGGQVKGLTIGIADLHLAPEIANSYAADTLYGSVGWRGERSTHYQTVISYRDEDPTENPFLLFKTYTLGIIGNELKGDEHEISYGYTFTAHRNSKRQGNDYAYDSHGIHGMIGIPLSERWSSYLNSDLSLFLYSNPDSSTQFQKRRTNWSLGLGGGISYRFGNGLSLFAGYDHYIQRSSLPIGFVYNQLQILEGYQDKSLGSYASDSINFGVRYNL